MTETPHGRNTVTLAEPKRTDRDEPAGGASQNGYRYRLNVHQPSGLLRRWSGRVVAIDRTGRQHHRSWKTAFSRDSLIAKLVDEVTLDTTWRTGPAESVEIWEINRST